MATSPSGFVDRGKGKSKSDQNFYSVQTGIVAFNAGGQASATPLTAQNCFVLTVGTGGTSSIKLPAAQAGMEITVINQSAAVGGAIVFPQTGETINGQAANASVTQAVTSVLIFYCGIQGAWWTK